MTTPRGIEPTAPADRHQTVLDSFEIFSLLQLLLVKCRQSIVSFFVGCIDQS